MTSNHVEKQLETSATNVIKSQKLEETRKIIISRDHIEYLNGFHHISTPDANIGFLFLAPELMAGKTGSFLTL